MTTFFLSASQKKKKIAFPRTLSPPTDSTSPTATLGIDANFSAKPPEVESGEHSRQILSRFFVLLSPTHPSSKIEHRRLPFVHRSGRRQAVDTRPCRPCGRRKKAVQPIDHVLFASVNAHSSQGIKASTSSFSTVAPHQIRRPAGASL